MSWVKLTESSRAASVLWASRAWGQSKNTHLASAKEPGTKINNPYCKGSDNASDTHTTPKFKLSNSSLVGHIAQPRANPFPVPTASLLSPRVFIIPSVEDAGINKGSTRRLREEVNNLPFMLALGWGTTAKTASAATQGNTATAVTLSPGTFK